MLENILGAVRKSAIVVVNEQMFSDKKSLLT